MIKKIAWGKNTVLNDADLPPELVTQPEGVVGCNQVEEGGDDSDDGVDNYDNDDTRARFRERSWDRRSEEEGHRRELRRERELEIILEILPCENLPWM